MKRLLLLVLIIQSAPCFAQTEKEQVKNAIGVFNTGKIDSAIALMHGITEKYPSLNNWDMLVKMYRERYDYANSLQTSNIAALIGQTMGADMKTTSYTSTAVCFKDLINISREAMLYSESTTASQLLRNYLVDDEGDKTTVPEAASKERDEAETFFDKKDYTNARLHYEKALAIYPDYYAAILYLGDTFWYLGKMDSAISRFRQAIKMNPGLLEPRKYLVDALGYDKQNAEAKKECYQAIYIFPDLSMFLKYSDLIKREGKVFNRQWIKRGCEINDIRSAQTTTANPVWATYQQAKNNIKLYCDSNGIIVKPTTLTKSKYLEVYSWENMLAKTVTLIPELLFAKKMADAGFLDCYVFISVFHYDMYEQYKDFVKNNKDRIKQYMETYLVQ